MGRQQLSLGELVAQSGSQLLVARIPLHAGKKWTPCEGKGADRNLLVLCGVGRIKNIVFFYEK